MSATIDLLDRYIKASALPSDNAVAKSLGIGRAAVSKWRNGLGHPDADSVAAMCAATGQAIAHWLPLIEAERARNPEARKVWLRLAQMAAAVTLVVGLSPAHAGAAPSAHKPGTLYIM
ncbi:helix-turn-helix transcriptional regulator [Dyella sp. ASV21]|uniref:helix-turn-helix domain-containing protein n=1 Tax=Dyella sp. ASV21 TaxID=2795114 RepID=UPI0018EBCEFF|nr:helix-turn-helix transcriptional regulator [Dyella sp. ASV21]